MNTLDEPVCETIVFIKLIVIISDSFLLEKRFMENLGEIESGHKSLKNFKVI